ncbi:MAG TPA: addiction module toxin, HicA family [Bacteroidetes bacterium]|nr:addiction module toxin, HicA family [Bacteroidota bacterium]HEX04466.1 addiction module toxin, HicA family [Bacteroidota bacterium]
MTPRLPTLSAKKTIRALKKAGFSVTGQKGSHIYLGNSDGRYTTVPNHAGDISRGLLFSILDQAGLTPEEFHKLL